MSRRGLASRRESERLMREGLVRVDGRVHTDPGERVSIDCDISIAQETSASLWKPTVLINKPRGLVTANPDSSLGQTPAWTLLSRDNLAPDAARDYAKGDSDGSAWIDAICDNPESMSPCGRLDRESRGLLLMTLDGVLARRIIGSSGGEVRQDPVWKRYLVTCHAAPTKAQVAKLDGNDRLSIDGVRLQPMRVRLLPANFSTTSTAEAIGFAPPPRYDACDAHPFDVRGCVLEFTLSEGRKHQIRKVCRKVGLRVVDLYRVTIGPWDVAGLPEGAWRPLNQTEIGRIGPKLRGSLEASSKMQAGSNRKPFD